MSVPSPIDVEITIRALELPWHEAMWVRNYYRWCRLRTGWQWGKAAWFVGTVFLWTGIVVVLIILALAAGV